MSPGPQVAFQSLCGCSPVRAFPRHIKIAFIVRKVSIKVFLKRRQDLVASTHALLSYARPTLYAFRAFPTPESMLFVRPSLIFAQRQPFFFPPRFLIFAKAYLFLPTLPMTTAS
jgi:hypothetical protein